MGDVRKLEVCVNNAQLGSRYVWDRVAAQYPDIRLRSWDCLGYCERCLRVPFVLLDDVVYLEADSPETLWHAVQQHLETNREPPE